MLPQAVVHQEGKKTARRLLSGRSTMKTPQAERYFF
jgi:hypothetical protein